jgi:hypothetical protein
VNDPTDKDWTSAACVDALVEGLTLQALQAAHDVSATPQEFYWAVQMSIALNEIVKGDRT